ncbi:MAG TPA: tRNA pseudouridine(38-40) synthase TruA [Balneolaceae bacterium]|nr:tRNA pseudouridine(38-40) synthase TruA [Balneolaceae bacterium]
MPRYKISISYDGTAYCGWQRQPNVNTVEEEVEEALGRILRTSVDVIGQGRTDSGVHAEAQVAHFDYEEPIDKDKLLYGLLGVLPRDISVWEMEKVPDDFHARFEATSRQYRYQIVTRPAPLLRNLSIMVWNDLDMKAMHTCAGMICGTHNFVNFRKTNENRQDAVCTINHSVFQIDDYKITYRIRANRFVHHMVRRLVGSMLNVGKGKWEIDRFFEMLQSPECRYNGHGAAAKALILEKIIY